METELKSILLELSRASHPALIRCLPQILNQLISLIVCPPTLPSTSLNIAGTVFEAIGLLVKNVTNLQDGQVDSHGRHALLNSYVAYQCSIPQSNVNSYIPKVYSNPDLSIEDLEMEIHSKNLDRTASMRQEGTQPVIQQR